MAGKDLKAQLEIGADASGVEAGVGKAKRSLADLGAAAAAAGDKGSEGLDKVGAGAEKSSQRVDRATKGLIGSIERTTAALEAGGRGSAKYFETLGQQRGVSADALKPYLDQLQAVQTKQLSVKGAVEATLPVLKQTGVSAAQTANALRGVPAQFTDIVTSLQGGQAPLTVFLQQGGQLKDMFGGIGPAARALGGYIGGLINPLTLAAAAIAATAIAYRQGTKEGEEYNKQLILTGGAAGVTAGQLALMARAISGTVGTQGAAAEVLAKLAGSGEIAGSEFQKLGQAAIQLERTTGQAIGDTVKQFTDLGKDPLDAALKLNQSLHFLTLTSYEQIKSLTEQGRVADAARVAQTAYADAVLQRTSQLSNNLGTLDRAWLSVKDSAKGAWDFMLNLGRGNTVQEQLADMEKQLAQRNERGPLNPATVASFEKGNQLLKDRIATLRESVALDNRAALAAKSVADQVAARAQFDKDGAQFDDNKAKAEKEIAKARAEGALAGASQAQIETRIGLIREKYKDTKGLEINKSTLAADLDALKNAADQLQAIYSTSARVLESVRAAGLLGDTDYYEAKRAFIRLESAAKEEELQGDIERLQKEKLNGKDRIDNEKKIADAQSKLLIVRSDAAAKTEILNNQQAASAVQVAKAYEQARQAAQDYFDSVQRQQARALAGAGQGAVARDLSAGLNQIDDRYADQRRELANQRALAQLQAAGGKLTAEQEKQFDDRLALLDEFQKKSIDSYADYYSKLRTQQADWTVGASEALHNYLDNAANVAKQTEDLFTRAFGGIEDALVKFVQTGKLNFSDFANQVIADLIRIQARAAIGSALGGSGGLGGLLGLLGGGSGLSVDTSVAGSTGGITSDTTLPDLLRGGRAIGGPVSRGGLYPINEDGRPEVLKMAGKQYLMTGSQGGTVERAGRGQAGGASGPAVLNVGSVGSGVSYADMLNAMRRALGEYDSGLRRSARQGSLG
jgi:lambda family phage tail tape measure protein